jgi:hypothetical protein
MKLYVILFRFSADEEPVAVDSGYFSNRESANDYVKKNREAYENHGWREGSFCAVPVKLPRYWL